MSDSLATPWTVGCQAALSRDFPDNNTGVGCHFFLHGLLLTWGSNLCLLLGRRILYHCITWEAEDGINLKIKTGWDDGMEKLQLPRDRSLTATVMTIPTRRGKSMLSTQVRGQKAGTAFTEGSEGRWCQEEGAAGASARGSGRRQRFSNSPYFYFLKHLDF